MLELGNLQGWFGWFEAADQFIQSPEFPRIFLNFPPNATRIGDLTRKLPPLTNLVCREMRKVEPIKRSKAILERKIEAESRIEFVPGEKPKASRRKLRRTCTRNRGRDVIAQSFDNQSGHDDGNLNFYWGDARDAFGADDRTELNDGIINILWEFMNIHMAGWWCHGDD